MSREPCTCPPSRGQIINRRAYTGSQIVALRAQLPEVEKQARKTPPKTLAAEMARVDAARAALPALHAELDALEARYAELRSTEAKPSTEQSSASIETKGTER